MKVGSQYFSMRIITRIARFLPRFSGWTRNRKADVPQVSINVVPQTDPSPRTSPLNPIFMFGNAPPAHEVLPEIVLERHIKEPDKFGGGVHSTVAINPLCIRNLFVFSLQGLPIPFFPHSTDW